MGTAAAEIVAVAEAGIQRLGCIQVLTVRYSVMSVLMAVIQERPISAGAVEVTEPARVTTMCKYWVRDMELRADWVEAVTPFPVIRVRALCQKDTGRYLATRTAEAALMAVAVVVAVEYSTIPVVRVARHTQTADQAVLPAAVAAARSYGFRRGPEARGAMA